MSETMDQLLLTEMEKLFGETTPETPKTRNSADALGTSEGKKKKGKTGKTRNASVEKANRAKCLPSFNTAPTWAIQCKECKKWRVIPTQEEYEDIRKELVQQPFTCQRKENVSCNDPSDLDQGTGLWAMDKPNLPKSPAGFKRKLSLRNNMNRLDCYYKTPTGKNLRGPPEVAAFLSKHEECNGISPNDFDFRAPKIAKEIAKGASSPLAG